MNKCDRLKSRPAPSFTGGFPNNGRGGFRRRRRAFRSASTFMKCVSGFLRSDGTIVSSGVRGEPLADYSWAQRFFAARMKLVFSHTGNCESVGRTAGQRAARKSPPRL